MKSQNLLQSNFTGSGKYGGYRLIAVMVVTVITAVMITACSNQPDIVESNNQQGTIAAESTKQESKSVAGESLTEQADSVISPRIKPSEPVKAEWINVDSHGETVSISLGEVEKYINTHFKIGNGSGEMNFMAYALENKLYVRANVCPPCRSIGYTLDKSVLVCDRCATTFQADTGDGIGGACVDFPKALVDYQVVGDEISMDLADLTLAYQDTLKPGWP
jgi:hypothetical protein